MPHIGTRRNPPRLPSLARPPRQTPVRVIWRKWAPLGHPPNPPRRLPGVRRRTPDRDRSAAAVVTRAVQTEPVPLLMERPTVLQQRRDNGPDLLLRDRRSVKSLAHHQHTPASDGGRSARSAIVPPGKQSPLRQARGMWLGLTYATGGRSPLVRASQRDCHPRGKLLLVPGRSLSGARTRYS